MTDAVAVNIDIGLLPDGAFDQLEVPAVNGHLVFGGAQHRLWLCRVIWVTAHALASHGRRPTAEQVLERITDIAQVDQIYVEYAQRIFTEREPAAWTKVMQLAEGLNSRALPLRYKSRDMRVAALKLSLNKKPVADLILKGLVTLTEHDPERYRTLIMLACQMDAARLARAALSALPGHSMANQRSSGDGS